MKRVEQSEFLNKLFSSIEKKAFGIERISNGPVKEDPFEDIDFEEVWKISGNKLLKNKSKEQK